MGVQGASRGCLSEGSGLPLRLEMYSGYSPFVSPFSSPPHVVSRGAVTPLDRMPQAPRLSGCPEEIRGQERLESGILLPP